MKHVKKTTTVDDGIDFDRTTLSPWDFYYHYHIDMSTDDVTHTYWGSPYHTISGGFDKYDKGNH